MPGWPANRRVHAIVFVCASTCAAICPGRFDFSEQRLREFAAIILSHLTAAFRYFDLRRGHAFHIVAVVGTK
jgi:hypothetical protein